MYTGGGVLITLLVLFLAGCNPNPPAENNSSNTTTTVVVPHVNHDDAFVTEVLGKISLEKTTVTAVGDIAIQNVPEIKTGEEFSVTTSEPIITYDAENKKLVIATLPEETKEVEITFTFKKGETTKSRIIKVKVFKDGSTPSDADYLDSLQLPAEVSDNFTLPAQLDNGKAITWTSENDKIIKINGNTAIVICDFVKQTTKLTATVGTNTKDFNISILPLTKYEIPDAHNPNVKTVYEFTENTITEKTIEDEKLIWGTIYDAEFDAISKTMTVTPKLEYNNYLSTEWLPVDKIFKLEYEEELQDLHEYISGCKNLDSLNTISLENIKQAFHSDFEGRPEKEVFNRLFNGYITYEEFTGMTMTPEEKTGKIKEFLKGRKTQSLNEMNLPETASWDDIENAYANEYKKGMQMQIDNEKKPKSYEYEITKNSENKYEISAKTKYNSEIEWFENTGRWHYDKIGIRASQEAGKIEGELDINDGAVSLYLRGEYTGSGTNFTFTGKDESETEYTANITDNKDGTLTIEITINGELKQYTVNFSGDEFF